MYLYQLTIRPADDYTTPDGSGRQFFFEQNLPFYAKREYGQVGYSEPLSLKDIEHYSLVPVTQAQALNGKVFTRKSRQETAFYSLEVDDNACIYVRGRLGDTIHDDYMRYVDIAKRIASGDWTELAPAPAL